MVQGEHIKIVREYLTKVRLIPEGWMRVTKAGGSKGKKTRVDGHT